MRDQELIGLYEAYQQVHGLNESTEELEYDTQYSYEDWVNQLVEEGYDLSNWTDEGLFEYYEQLCEKRVEIGQSPTPGGITPKKPVTSAIPPLPRRGTPVNTGYRESYDIVFEYLMTEGYADTNENALVIMANMSEDWRESILSESLSIDRGIRFREIDKKNRREGKPRAADGDTRNQQFDTTSFGKGNKATRRQGYNVTDTSTWPDQEGRRSEHDANRGVKRKKSGNVNYQQQPK